MKEMDETRTMLRIKTLVSQHDETKKKSLEECEKAKENFGDFVLAQTNIANAKRFLNVCSWLLRTVKLYAKHLEDLRTRDKPVKVSFD